MGIEREIKLALPAGQVDAATQFFTARTGEAGRASALENIYFDTPALTLARSNASRDGLWSGKFLFVALGAMWAYDLFIDADALLFRQAAPELIELFRTNFTRTLWHVSRDGADLEAVIDQGDVIANVSGETRRAPISEIELELKRGEEAALHTLAAELTAQLPGLAPDDVSKAQRGYSLRER